MGRAGPSAETRSPDTQPGLRNGVGGAMDFLIVLGALCFLMFVAYRG